jgi:hypothetical protein
MNGLISVQLPERRSQRDDAEWALLRLQIVFCCLEAAPTLVGFAVADAVNVSPAAQFGHFVDSSLFAIFRSAGSLHDLSTDLFRIQCKTICGRCTPRPVCCGGSPQTSTSSMMYMTGTLWN